MSAASDPCSMKSRYCVSKANCVAVDNVGKCVCPDDLQGDGETNGTGCYNGKSVRYRSMLLGPNSTNPWIGRSTAPCCYDDAADLHLRLV